MSWKRNQFEKNRRGKRQTPSSKQNERWGESTEDSNADVIRLNDIKSRGSFDTSFNEEYEEQHPRE